MRRSLLVILLGLIGTGGWLAWHGPADGDAVRFFDVGQGDAALVSSGDQQVLVDAGPDSSVLAQLGRSLPPFDRTIEVVVISHPHADHYRGLLPVLDRYQVGQLYVSAANSASPEYQSLLTAARQHGTTVRTPGVGEHIRLGTTELRFLASGLPNPTSDNLNNASIAVTVTQHDCSTLFPGDAEEAEERQLSQVGLPRVDILKVPHHGSRTSSTTSFLAATHAQWGVVSVGAQNRYGHPNPGTLRRLSEAGVRIYRTDRHGSITATAGATGCLLTTDR
jgi:competence protein ComEC